jgi:hypothetical protein
MTEESAHSIAAPSAGRGSDPATRGATIGSGLVPEEAVEGAAETAAHSVGPQPAEGLVEPGGVDTEETR